MNNSHFKCILNCASSLWEELWWKRWDIFTFSQTYLKVFYLPNNSASLMLVFACKIQKYKKQEIVNILFKHVFCDQRVTDEQKHEIFHWVPFSSLNVIHFRSGPCRSAISQVLFISMAAVTAEQIWYLSLNISLKNILSTIKNKNTQWHYWFKWNFCRGNYPSN